jgi:hypothetical protein
MINVTGRLPEVSFRSVLVAAVAAEAAGSAAGVVPTRNKYAVRQVAIIGVLQSREGADE